MDVLVGHDRHSTAFGQSNDKTNAFGPPPVISPLDEEASSVA